MLKTLPEIVSETKNSLRCLTADEARQALAGHSDALVIDVREPGEVQEKPVPGSVNIPRGILEMKIPEYTTDPEHPIYVHCATGGRSALAAAALTNMGFRNVYLLDCDCDSLIRQLAG